MQQPQPSLRAAGYVRVSTDEQVKHGWNLEEDRQRIRERCESQRWDLVEIFDDGGLRGDDPDRPGLKRMLASLDRLDVLVLRSIDRLSRDLYIYAGAVRAIVAAKVQVSDFDRMIDLASPEGGAMAGMQAVFAELEKKNIGKRLKEMVDARARAGQHAGGQRPYGFQRRDKGIVPDPVERVIVLRVFELADQGMSQRAIAKLFLAEGIRSRDGGHFAQSMIGQMLSNPLYCGRIKHNGEIFPGQHEAIVPVDLWKRVNAARASKPRRTGGRPVSGLHLLTKGVLRCGRCGSAMIPARPGHDAYACHGRAKWGPTFCDRSAVSRRLVDETLLQELTSRYVDLDEMRRRVANRRDAALAESLSAKTQAEREEAKVEGALARVRRDYIEGAISAADWHELRDELAAELEAAEANVKQVCQRWHKLEAAGPLLDAEQAVLGHLAALREAIADGVGRAPDLDALRTIIRQLFESIELCGPDNPFGSAPYGKGHLDAHGEDVRAGEYWLFFTLRSESFDFDEPRRVPLPVETDQLTFEAR